MDRTISKLHNGLQLDGKEVTLGAETPTVIFQDGSGNVLLATGTTVPTDATAGYAKGALFIKTDVVTGTSGLYENVGTTSSCAFTGLSSITSAEIASGAVTTAKIADANVTLAKLAAGIAPSHITKFAAQYTTTGGAAAEAITVSGVAATDIVLVTLMNGGTNTVSVVKAVPTTNTITVTFSGDPSNDAVIHYAVLRAAA